MRRLRFWRVLCAPGGTRLSSDVGQPREMNRYRVIVHGVFRAPSSGDKDGSGFYTARMVEAECSQDAAALALGLIAGDKRASQPGTSGVALRAALSIDQIVTLDRNDKFDDGPLGFIFYDGAQPEASGDAGFSTPVYTGSGARRA